MNYREREISFAVDGIETSGLFNTLGYELYLHCSLAELTSNQILVEFIIDYVLDYSAKLAPGETMQYGFWILKFQLYKSKYLDIWEFCLDFENWQRGAAFAIRLLEEQKAICEEFDIDAEFPEMPQNVVISDGVLEGMPVEAVRYPSPEHMSGWWISTDAYNDDIDTLKVIHIHELCTRRADLIKFLMLPFGFRFDTRNGEEVWFDEVVAKHLDASK